MLTDSTGTVQQTYGYEPYGEVTSTGSSNNPYQYTGRENDGTGLYYYRARYYSPSLKRFISEDPMRLAAALNEYGYADEDPISLTDPSGTEAVAFLLKHPKHWDGFTYTPCQIAANIDFTLNLIPFVGTAYAAGKLLTEQGNYSDLADGAGTTLEQAAKSAESSAADNSARADDLKRMDRSHREQRLWRKTSRAANWGKLFKIGFHSFTVLSFVLNAEDFQEAYHKCGCGE